MRFCEKNTNAKIIYLSILSVLSNFQANLNVSNTIYYNKSNKEKLITSSIVS